MTRPLRVLIVDDSALMRQMLTTILSADPDIEVVDTASDPLIAREKIRRHNPDVLTLDVEMPRMNGLDFLEKIMTLRPMPVVMISSLTETGTAAAVRALEIGAVDVVGKPQGFVADGLASLAEEIVTKVKAAGRSQIQTPANLVTATSPPMVFGRGKLICIGASTGGIPAIATILRQLPSNAPPVVIVQHMPAGFTERFAARLDSQCALRVSEATDGVVLESGHAYVAPGGLMTRLAGHSLSVTSEPRINGFSPSVDALFESAASGRGADSVGVLLTGMGSDGARGLLTLRQAGGLTLGQDAATCVVYGMPRAAFELGAVVRQLPISKIAAAIIEACRASPQPAIHTPSPFLKSGDR